MCLGPRIASHDKAPASAADQEEAHIDCGKEADPLEGCMRLDMGYYSVEVVRYRAHCTSVVAAAREEGRLVERSRCCYCTEEAS